MSVAAETNFLGKTLIIYVAAMQLRFHQNSKFYKGMQILHRYPCNVLFKVISST